MLKDKQNQHQRRHEHGNKEKPRSCKQSRCYLGGRKKIKNENELYPQNTQRQNKKVMALHLRWWALRPTVGEREDSSEALLVAAMVKWSWRRAICHSHPCYGMDNCNGNSGGWDKTWELRRGGVTQS